MQNNPQDTRAKLTRALSLPADISNDDARDSVLDFYSRNRSSCTSEDTLPTESDRLRRSIYRALAYEDTPDTYLVSTPKSTARISNVRLPPPRPLRPRNSSQSWIKNSSGNPWIDISLDKEPATIEVVSPGSRTFRSISPTLCSPTRMSDTSELGISSRMSLDKGLTKPTRPVGFWHHSLRKERWHVLNRWAAMTLGLCIFILIVLSLFWAVVVTVDTQMDHLHVYVVNFENQSDALVGPIVTSVTEAMVRNESEIQLGFESIPPGAFRNDPMEVREAVWQEEVWAAIVINSNATQMLRQAVGFANTSYDPNGAVQIIYNEARQQDVYFDHIYPLMQIATTKILAEFGKNWTQEIMSNGAVTKANLERVPQAVNPGIGFSIFQLRPFLPHTGMPAVSIGLIYLIIISFFSFGFYLPIHMRFMKGPGHAPLKFWQFILWRWIATIIAYLFLSLAYSMVSLAFDFPFGNAPGSHYFSEVAPSKFYNATFIVYWMINFLGMIALGLACENMAMLLGMPWTALWLIFWVITNVSTAFYEITLEASFYQWGYAWPLHNIVEASRTTLFDLKSHLALNFGVLLAWVVVNTAIFPFAALYMKWKTARDMQRQQQQAAQMARISRMAQKGQC